MDAEVKTLLNKTLGAYSDDCRGNVRRIITGTVDECVRRGVIPRHTLAGLELAPRIVTAEQYEQQNTGMVAVADDTVRMLADGTRYLHLCWQASENGRELEPLKHRKAGDFRDVPVPDMIWDMVQELPDGPLCPGPNGTPYMPYSTAGNRFGRILDYLGISGVHTHSLRHQFASEALDASPAS